MCDDIKSSVRVAAMSLAMTLTGILTRSLEATDATNNKANVMLEQVIPFLLSPSGLESSAQDVQAFALDTLLKIIKSGGRKTLQPFVPNIVSHLLALLSSLEPGAVNYVRLNADRYDISTERIDDIRLNSVRGSPMMEAIERCLDFLDEKTMALLSPSLENAIKTAIGLPSKVGSTRVLVSLSTRHNYIFKIYADQFLRLARKQVLDRNDTVSSAFAAACGYLTRLSSDKEILMLVGHCQQLYFDSDDERHRRVSGEIVYAISKYAKDRFDAVASAILPFTFVAKHDASERTKASFQDTWSENVGGSRSVRLYLKEIISLASKYLRSHQWSIKHASARAVASVVSSLGNEIDEASAKEIWPALEDAIQGKTWEGKEVILEGLIQFVKGSNILATDEFISDQVEAILLRESKRNNPAYRRYALGCLGDFVELAKKKNLFAQVYAITQPVITEALSNSHEMDVDGHSGGSSSKTIIDATLANSIAALLKSINPQSQSETLLTSSLRQTLELSTQVLATAGKTAPLNTTFDAYKALFERLTLDQRQSPSGPLEDVLVRYAETLFSAKDSVEQTRIKAAEASLMLVTLARQNKRITEALVKTIAQTRQQERSTTVQQILDRARKQLER